MAVEGVRKKESETERERERKLKASTQTRPRHGTDWKPSPAMTREP